VNCLLVYIVRTGTAADRDIDFECPNKFSRQ